MIKGPYLDLNRKKTENIVSLIDWFAARRKDQFVGKVSQDPEESDGLWVKCSECGQVAYRKDLISNFNVCSNCGHHNRICLLYTSPSPRDLSTSRMPSSA